MKTLKSILIKVFAICMLGALVTLNVNVGSFPNLNLDTMSISMETQTVNAQADPSMMYLGPYFCRTVPKITQRCFLGGHGCDVSAQTVCSEPQEN